MILRFKSSFLGSTQRAGPTSVPDRSKHHDLGRHPESFLLHPEKLHRLTKSQTELLVVREYIEGSLDADLGVNDPARLHLVLLGLIAFCRMGLHMDDRTGNLRPSPDEFVFLRAEPLRMGDLAARELSEILGRGIRLGLFDINALAFEKAIHSLEIYLKCGLHRCPPH